MYGRANANESRRVGSLTAALRRGAVAACVLAAAVSLMACGGVTGTSSGAVYTGPNGGTKLSQDLLKDPAQFPLLRATGTGSSESASFSAGGVWDAEWAYDCSGNSGSIQVLARNSQGSTFSLGSYNGNAHAVGQSQTMGAGNYKVVVTTGATCDWAVGTRPQPHP